MTEPAKFGFLRKVLRTLGLSPEAVDDLVEWIAALLASDPQGETPNTLQFPYRLRDDFLSPAEHSFSLVLRDAVGEQARVCPKVSLGDLFYVRADDAGTYRVYTNKIDRKHVDFLLCDPQTMRPLCGIELDDKSHSRRDRQERDRYVEGVFAAAGLPLVRIPVQRAYPVEELAARLCPHLTAGDVAQAPVQQPLPAAVVQTQVPTVSREAPAIDGSAEAHSPATAVQEDTAPTCPKCGSVMVLRTAKQGTNQGKHFWGCPQFPRCRTVMPYMAEAVTPPKSLAAQA